LAQETKGKKGGTSKAAKPATKPTAKPATKPTAKPATKPTAKPAAKPTAKPAAKPAGKPAAGRSSKRPGKRAKGPEIRNFAAYKDKEGERSTRTVPVLSVEGKEKRTIHLPKVFDEPLRVDLIARAVQASRANRRQPYGAPREGVWAGRRHSTEWWGKGRGVSRVQRLKDGQTAATSPNNVGGARAHPPRVAQIRGEKINVKERQKARRSAIAAVASIDLVAARGHRWDEGFKLPIVLEAEFETLFERAVKDRQKNEDTSPTKALLTVLHNIGLDADIERARTGVHVRAGRGKMRGRRKKTPRSVLIVASNAPTLVRAARNLPGVDVTSPKSLSTESLAPGGTPGRLTVFTESALAQIKEMR
jgi:large subunit ribosomal protein L4e